MKLLYGRDPRRKQLSIKITFTNIVETFLNLRQATFSLKKREERGKRYFKHLYFRNNIKFPQATVMILGVAVLMIGSKRQEDGL